MPNQDWQTMTPNEKIETLCKHVAAHAAQLVELEQLKTEVGDLKSQLTSFAQLNNTDVDKIKRRLGFN
jgi:hypothetical protein